MLFQKIVSNLGALFSMQTPLGSRTIYFLPLTRDLVLIYIYVNWIANLTWRPLGQAAFLLSSENSSLNFVLSHQVAAFVCCKLSADLQCIPVKQCLPSFHFAFSASLQFLSQRLVSTLLWFCSNSQAFSSVPSVGWKDIQSCHWTGLRWSKEMICLLCLLKRSWSVLVIEHKSPSSVLWRQHRLWLLLHSICWHSTSFSLLPSAWVCTSFLLLLYLQSELKLSSCRLSLIFPFQRKATTSMFLQGRLSPGQCNSTFIFEHWLNFSNCVFWL